MTASSRMQSLERMLSEIEELQDKTGALIITAGYDHDAVQDIKRTTIL